MGPGQRNELMFFPGCNANPLTFTPDGRGLIAGKAANLIHLALPVHAEYLTLKEHQFGIPALAYSPDGKYIAWISNDKSAQLWNSENGTMVEMAKFAEPSRCLVFSPDGQTVFLGDTHTAGDKKKVGKIARWDIKSGKRLASLFGHESAITALAVSPRHSLLVSASNDEMKLWDLTTGKEIDHLNKSVGLKLVRSLAFHPTEKLLAGASGARVVLWDLGEGTFKEQKTIPGIPHSVTFTAGGNYLIISSLRDIALFDWKQDKVVHRLGPFTGGIFMLSP